jgi:GNAT superfamily N-acetyltransferase
MVRMTTAQSRATLHQILDLQARNLAAHLSPAEAADQGFVTLRHDLPLLERLCGPYRHVIAMDGDRLVGYALVMLKEFGSAFPVLAPMFEQIDRLTVGDRRLPDVNYFVLGQVCVEKEYRGKGVFRGLYEELKERMSGAFDLVVTEVASRNRRSLQAHVKVGFRRAFQYRSPDHEQWEIVTWDWRPAEAGSEDPRF